MKVCIAEKPSVAKDWIEENAGDLKQIDITSFDKKSTKSVWINKVTLDTLGSLPAPPPRIRILSPFDPMLRDRKRAEFLFGFDYRIEMFVPQAKRKYGYYVFPVLQGDKIIARIDMKADRKSGVLKVTRIWPEEKIKWTPVREKSLMRELCQLAKFSALDKVDIAPDALRSRP